MRKTMFACLIALNALQVLAAGIGLKSGLWETRVIKQIRDGKDMTAQVNGAVGQLQERLASMPPEQRAKMEAMMKGLPTASSNGTIQMCITPEMAREDKPFGAREGCPPVTVKRSGSHSTFEYSCTRNGNTTSGKGEATTTGDIISTSVDVTVQSANGDSHVMHTETEMKFVGTDCGDVKPMTDSSPTTPSPSKTSPHNVSP